jgi:hypothetical protein
MDHSFPRGGLVEGDAFGLHQIRQLGQDRLVDGVATPLCFRHGPEGKGGMVALRDVTPLRT